MNKYLSQYKTTVQAVLILACVACYFFNLITTEQLTVAMGVFASVGFIGAKDA